MKALQSVGRQGECHVDCINNPPYQDLAGGPCTVPSVQLLRGEDLFSLLGVLPIKQPEHLVERLKKGTAGMAAAVLWTLRQSEKIINEDIHIS